MNWLEVFYEEKEAKEVADNVRGWLQVKVEPSKDMSGNQVWLVKTEGGYLREDGTFQ